MIKTIEKTIKLKLMPLTRSDKKSANFSLE